MKYSEAQVNDKAFNCVDTDDFMGTVLWKGTYEELKDSKYAHTARDWEDFMDAEDIKTYDLIVIDTDYGPTLFNYDNDPCGVICKD